MRRDGTKDRRMWDEMPKKRLLCLYYHSPILFLGFSYDAYMMLLRCSYVGGFFFGGAYFIREDSVIGGMDSGDK